MHRQRQVVARVDHDQVVAGAAREQRAVTVPASHPRDIGPRHCAGVGRRDPEARAARWRQWDLAADEVRRHVAVVGEHQAGERAVLMHLLDDPLVQGQILRVPQADAARIVGGMVDVALFVEDHPPAALRLDPAHRCQRRWMQPPHAVAVRCLVEAIAGGDRPEPHRLEQHVVSRISAHPERLPRVETGTRVRCR